MKRLAPYIKPYRKECVIAPLLKCMEALMDLFVPLVMADLVDIGIRGNNPSYIWRVSLILFALATILGWGYYGMRCAQYLFGDRAFGLFVLLQAATVILGAVLNTGTVWLLADTFNGLMAIPNLIALLALSPEFVNLILDFQRYIGGTYENIYQCKPLRTVAYAEIPSAGSSGTK